MAEYSISEVERATGVKAHVLRYWEEAIPLIRPRKDAQGRRFYGARDVELISRVKYLVQEKKYTLAGAGERLLAELTDSRRERAIREIETIRSDLSRALEIARKRTDEGKTDERE